MQLEETELVNVDTKSSSLIPFIHVNEYDETIDPSKYKNDAYEHVNKLVRNFINNYNLNGGLILSTKGLRHGNKKSFDFNQLYVKDHSFNFNQVHFIPKLLICEKKNDSYFAENHIDMTSESDIPMEWCTIIDHTKDSVVHPLFDNKQKEEIYFTITYQRVDLFFKKEYIRLSDEFGNMVDDALKETDPHSALINIFFTFGNFFAKKITLGHKLFKHIDKDWYESIKEKQFNDYIGVDKLQDLIKEMDYDGKGFLTVNGEIINQENLNSWIELCKNDSNLQIIKRGDLVAVYEILEDCIHDEVKSILGIREHQYLKPREIYQEHLKLPKVKYQVIMTGCEKIQSSVVYHRITFPKRLENSDFLLYGSITNESGEQIDNMIIKFRLINYYGFSVTIENFTGYENPYVQNYFVAKVGTKIFNNKDLESLIIELPQPLKNVKNAKFACTFNYSSDDGPSFSASIESVDKNGIRLHIKDYNKIKSHLTSTFDEYIMHWCIYFIPLKKITIGQVIPVNQSLDKIPRFLRTKSSKQVPGLRNNVYEAISAFRAILPWFDALNIMLEKISKAYEEAEYNRKTCRVLTDRADDVLTALHRVFRDIKDFIGNISQLKGLSKFVSAEDIRKRCIFLMNELESSCLDLNLTTISVEDKRIVQKSLMEDVDTMTEFFETIKGGVIQDDIKDIRYKKEVVIPRAPRMPSKVFDEVAEIKRKMERKEITLNAPQINPSSLQEDERWIQKDGCRVFKRLLNGKVEVACKRIKIPDSGSQMFNTRFAILKRLKVSDKIIKFHGLAKYSDHYLVVFDWAECGNLKEVYERKKLENNRFLWEDKVKIGLDICNGLTFLQGCNIFHYDIRCENILISGKDKNYNAKLAKFDLSRHANHISTKIKSIDEFGKREHLNFDNNSPRCIVAGFSRIIQTAWTHEPAERPCINTFNAELNKLSLLLKNNDIDLDEKSHLTIINIDEHEYIKYLRKSAANGNPTALFYYGVLTLDGKYVEKDENIGIQYLELATAKGQKQAIDELKKRNIDFGHAKLIIVSEIEESDDSVGEF
ncbi:13703_t:CDS:10 [Cetraspora pellucida]|uniref:13703_t:CDS:1 n=1 Tax=Cetraspora pellucida TaxID=1433469 RepID=A0A9N9D2V6_9GLOM|nr:13703_t:CDS:10 [Cetraspora pellucida]